MADIPAGSGGEAPVPLYPTAAEPGCFTCDRCRRIQAGRLKALPFGWARVGLTTVWTLCSGCVDSLSRWLDLPSRENDEARARVGAASERMLAQLKAAKP